MTVLIGKLSADILAGHQIALTVASTTFMIPLGISSAAAVPEWATPLEGVTPKALRAPAGRRWRLVRA